MGAGRDRVKAGVAELAGAGAPASARDALVGLTEVKRMTALSRSTIYRWSASGEFPKPVRVGPRASRWFLSELNTWIEEHRLNRHG